LRWKKSEERKTNLVEPSNLGDLLPQPPEIHLLVINDRSRDIGVPLLLMVDEAAESRERESAKG